MARLFIRHEPVDCHVIKPEPAFKPTEWSFKVNVYYLTAAGLNLSPFSNDLHYVCFVHEGKCWAARSVYTFGFAGQEIACFRCVPFNDDPSGQKMILADMILG